MHNISTVEFGENWREVLTSSDYGVASPKNVRFLYLLILEIV